MTQVSKRIVHKQIESRMYETLFEAIKHLRSKEEIQLFLTDLLSPTERTMLAKRLAIAALLMRAYEYESIMNMLKVSSATISKVALVLNHNQGYKNTINKIARSESAKAFWQQIERLTSRLVSSRNYSANDEFLKKEFGHKRKTLL